jgi:hypothetical protein
MRSAICAWVTSAAPIPQRSSEWTAIGSIVVTVFGLGVGVLLRFRGIG